MGKKKLSLKFQNKNIIKNLCLIQWTLIKICVLIPMHQKKMDWIHKHWIQSREMIWHTNNSDIYIKSSSTIKNVIVTKAQRIHGCCSCLIKTVQISCDRDKVVHAAFFFKVIPICSEGKPWSLKDRLHWAQNYRHFFSVAARIKIKIIVN